MKIKNLVVSTLIVGSLFTTVGCQSTQSAQSNNPEEVDNRIQREIKANEYSKVNEDAKTTEETTENTQEIKEQNNEGEFICAFCGKHHKESESYYNEDGISVCSKECFDLYTGNVEYDYSQNDYEFYCSECGRTILCTKEAYDLYNELGMCTDCNIHISEYNKELENRKNNMPTECPVCESPNCDWEWDECINGWACKCNDCGYMN